MGSITIQLKCPQCNNNTFCDYYYKSGEEYLTCPYCGYTWERKMVIDWEKHKKRAAL
jgi:ribosomal protein S27E